MLTLIFRSFDLHQVIDGLEEEELGGSAVGRPSSSSVLSKFKQGQRHYSASWTCAECKEIVRVAMLILISIRHDEKGNSKFMSSPLQLSDCCQNCPPCFPRGKSL